MVPATATESFISQELFFLLSLAAFVAFAVSAFRRAQPPRLDLPKIGESNLADCRDALVQGAKLYPNKPWVLPLQDPIVILPHSSLPLMKSAPENQLSLNKELYIRFLGRYTLLGQDDDEMVSVIRHDLTRSLSDIVDNILIDETKYALSQLFGMPSEWKSIFVSDALSRLVTMLNGRTFVGLPLSREEDWITSTILFTSEGNTVAQSLRPYPRILRPIVAPFLSPVRKLRKHQALVSARTRPLIEKYFGDALGGKASLDGKQDADWNKSGRLLTWLLGKYGRRVSASPHRIARDYLLSSAASIPIPASLLTHLLFELATRPEYVEPLREELREVIKKRGGWGHACLASLEKMDSFMRECQRLNSHGLTMVTRRTTAPLELQDGTVIPEGVSVGVSNYTLNRSPDLYEYPNEFRGFRFFEMRASSQDNGGKLQFGSVNPDNLNWGYGRHACPGRYFASAEIKVVLAYVISNYDMQLTERGRPENMVFGVLVIPNPSGELMFKKREPLPGLEL